MTSVKCSTPINLYYGCNFNIVRNNLFPMFYLVYKLEKLNHTPYCIYGCTFTLISSQKSFLSMFILSFTY